MLNINRKFKNNYNNNKLDSSLLNCSLSSSINECPATPNNNNNNKNNSSILSTKSSSIANSPSSVCFNLGKFIYLSIVSKFIQKTILSVPFLLFSVRS